VFFGEVIGPPQVLLRECVSGPSQEKLETPRSRAVGVFAQESRHRLPRYSTHRHWNAAQQSGVRDSPIPGIAAKKLVASSTRECHGDLLPCQGRDQIREVEGWVGERLVEKGN